MNPIVQMKWQTIEQSIDGAICLKVKEGTWVTLVYRLWELGGWTHWMLVPIDKTLPTILKPDGRPLNG